MFSKSLISWSADTLMSFTSEKIDVSSANNLLMKCLQQGHSCISRKIKVLKLNPVEHQQAQVHAEDWPFTKTYVTWYRHTVNTATF